MIIGTRPTAPVIGKNNGNLHQGGFIPKTLYPNRDQYKDRIEGINFAADCSGCGHYRMHWPQYCLNSKREFHISNLTRMVYKQSEFYSGVKVVRIQRQVSDTQMQLIKVLRRICDNNGIRLVYEIDDIPFYEDIPLYNAKRESYAKPSYKSNIEEMMNMCDEVTVTTKFMRDYLRSKLKNQKVTVIPNFIPRFWMDRFYNEDKAKINFSKHKKKPRILYPGSGSHYSIDAKIPDDFTALEDLVRKTKNEFQWVFFGGVPRNLVDLLKSGKIEYHGWEHVVGYPYKLESLKANIVIAPLLNNTFNKAKSNIKYIESCAFGLPVICQDISTYDIAQHKFNTPSDLYDKIKYLTADASVYMKESRKAHMASKDFWLEDNIGVWEEFYKFPYKDPDRELLNKFQ